MAALGEASAVIQEAAHEDASGAVLQERDRWLQRCAGKRHEGCSYLATCGTVCNKCGRVA